MKLVYAHTYMCFLLHLCVHGESFLFKLSAPLSQLHTLRSYWTRAGGQTGSFPFRLWMVITASQLSVRLNQYFPGWRLVVQRKGMYSCGGWGGTCPKLSVLWMYEPNLQMFFMCQLPIFNRPSALSSYYKNKNHRNMIHTAVYLIFLLTFLCNVFSWLYEKKKFLVAWIFLHCRYDFEDNLKSAWSLSTEISQFLKKGTLTIILLGCYCYSNCSFWVFLEAVFFPSVGPYMNNH